jgi:hypothetical protein
MIGCTGFDWFIHTGSDKDLLQLQGRKSKALLQYGQAGIAVSISLSIPRIDICSGDLGDQ